MTVDAVQPPPKLYRRASGRIIGGVAAGMAEHLGVSVWMVRAVFAGLVLAGGLGLVVYGSYWIVVPMSPADDAADRDRPRWLAVAVVIAAAVAVLITITVAPVSRFFGAIVLACLGAALIWRQATDTQRAAWRRVSRTSLTATPGDRRGVVRLLAGGAMVVAGAVLVLARRTDIDATWDVLLAVGVTVIGLALITGPLWIGVLTELTDERRARIRSEERAALAAQVHDSVLQTLALIQRSSADPRQVARLARSQERELRTLLYGAHDDATGRLASAIADAAGEVEDQFGITVETVVVGDAPLDDASAATVQAAREALVNAAKHAGVESVSLYTEVEPGQIVTYVRDRGAGFDAHAVPDDRQGLQGSIVGRMTRHGGTAHVRSTPDEGTEVELRMPR
jgi:signal transduction histidine kinase